MTILTKVCAFGSEEQRLAYFNLFLPYGIFPDLKDTETDLATAVLRYKGVVLDSMVEDRQLIGTSHGKRDKNLVRQLNADKTELAQLDLEEALPTRMDRISQLEQEIDKIEGEFAQQSTQPGKARAALSMTVDQVQAVIPDNGALIEDLSYAHYLGGRKWEQHYGALVLMSKGAPLWIPLGKADSIDELVQQYGALIRESGDDEELSKNLRSLYEVIWAPVARALPDPIKRLIISPDAQLCILCNTAGCR